MAAPRSGGGGRDLTKVPPRVLSVAYTVIREALTNAAKHSTASNVTVSITAADGELTVMVGDAGRGFTPQQEQAAREDRHFGLGMLRKRVAEVGGRIQIESQPGVGIRVLAQLPDRRGRSMKVLLVDDHTLVRSGLAHLLMACIPDAEITEAGGTEETLEVLKSTNHDVALVDIRMPGRDGLQLLKEIRSNYPKLPVIMLSSYDDGEYVKAALSEGAAGYLLKDTSPDDLVQAIKVALSGSGNVLSPRAVRNMFEGPSVREDQAADASARADAGLTRRESDVLELLATGCSNRDISRQLFLSEKTVKAHLAAVFRKLGVTNRTQAAMAAVAMGIGPPPAVASPAGAGAGLGHAPA